MAAEPWVEVASESAAWVAPADGWVRSNLGFKSGACGNRPRKQNLAPLEDHKVSLIALRYCIAALAASSLVASLQFR